MHVRVELSQLTRRFGAAGELGKAPRELARTFVQEARDLSRNIKDHKLAKMCESNIVELELEMRKLPKIIR